MVQGYVFAVWPDGKVKGYTHKEFLEMNIQRQIFGADPTFVERVVSVECEFRVIRSYMGGDYNATATSIIAGLTQTYHDSLGPVLFLPAYGQKEFCQLMVASCTPFFLLEPLSDIEMSCSEAESISSSETESNLCEDFLELASEYGFTIIDDTRADKVKWAIDRLLLKHMVHDDERSYKPDDEPEESEDIPADEQVAESE
jgi:hypothetical protein